MKMLSIIFAVSVGFWFSGYHNLIHTKPHHVIKRHIMRLSFKRGQASWYGCTSAQECPWGSDNTQGKPTASGVIFNTRKAMCASWYYPLHSWVLVENQRTHKSTACHILDRGPSLYTHRIIDLSYSVKQTIGMGGLGKVVVYSKVAPKLVADAF